MSGPDRIWAYEINYPISKVHGEKRWVPWEPKPITLQMREGFFGRKTRQIPQVFHEYIRRDPDVIAALPEVQALIAAAQETASRSRKREFDMFSGSIRALTPADAIAACDAVIEEAYNAGWNAAIDAYVD